MSAFWDKLTKDKEEAKASSKDTKSAAKKVAPAKSEKKEAAKKVSKAKPAKMNKEKAELFNRVLLRPIISENAMNHQMINKYVFEVSKSSTKSEVASAVEAAFGCERHRGECHEL